MFSFDESLRYINIFINRSLSSKLYIEFAPIITMKVLINSESNIQTEER